MCHLQFCAAGQGVCLALLQAGNLECAGAVLQEACCLQELCSHFHWLHKEEHQLESLILLSLGVPVADLPAFPE